MCLNAPCNHQGPCEPGAIEVEVMAEMGRRISDPPPIIEPPKEIRTCAGCGLAPVTYYIGRYPPCECGVDDWRRGDWIQTYSGRMFWPLHPRVEDFCIEDIAVPLSRKCRFGGHCKNFYSVADHSVWVMDQLADHPPLKLCGLLHDAAEAYLVDLPRPVKYDPMCAFYREVEGQIQAMIFAWAGVIDVAVEQAHFLKAVDAWSLSTEKRDNVIEGRGRWKGVEKIDPHPDEIKPTRSMADSAETFIHHFKRLFEETHGRPYR